MSPALRRRAFFLLNNVLAALLLTASAAPQTASPQSPQATLPNETPAHFKVAQETWDYSRRV